jgi:hypothetical protein
MKKPVAEKPADVQPANLPTERTLYLALANWLVELRNAPSNLRTEEVCAKLRNLLDPFKA